MVFFRFPFKAGVRCVFFEGPVISSNCVRNYIASHLRTHDYRLYCNGKELLEHQDLGQDATVYVLFSLPGGKGGFGSMLRAIGAQIEKTTNREACRDLSGRRLRDINEEQRLRKWLAKETEREAEKVRRRKERIERLKSQPKHNFVDFEYEKEISELPERIDDALSAGIQKASKRPVEVGEASCSSSSKKKRLWLDEEISASSDSDLDLQEGFVSQNKDLLIEHQDESNSQQEQETEESEIVASNSIDSCENKSSASEESVSEEETITQNVVLTEETGTSCSPVKNEEECSVNSVINGLTPRDESSHTGPKLDEPHSSKDVHKQDDSPLDLLSYESVSQLENIGLERLKSALIARNLKCGGTISDRAQRLWRVRGLQPHEYPSNLLAKIKK